jgi:hypothetical protein
VKVELTVIEEVEDPTPGVFRMNMKGKRLREKDPGSY